MAIQMRRGANSDFNPSKMLPGEIAVTTDGTRKVYAAFKANDVKELASKEDVQGLINGFTSVVDREIAEAEQRIESKGQQVLETIPDMYEEVSARADEAVRTKADAIVCTASGVNPIAKDSSNDYLRNLKLYGKTTQGENPSPNNPQPLESKGKWGNLLDDSTVKGYTVMSGAYAPNLTGKLLTGNVYTVITFTDGSIASNNGCSMAFELSNGSKQNVVIGGVTEIKEDVAKLVTGNVKLYFNEQHNGKTVKSIMVNEGTTPLPYRPYSGQMEIESVIGTDNILDASNPTVTRAVTTSFDEDSGVLTITNNGSWTQWFYDFDAVKGETYKFVCESLEGVENNNKCLITFSYPNEAEFKSAHMYYKVLDFIATETRKHRLCLFTNQSNNVATDTIKIIKPRLYNVNTSDGVYRSGKKQSHISLVSDGLKGIPVTDASLATYTDENGQMWCSDYVDCDRSVDVQKIETVTTNDTAKIYYNANLGTVSRIAYPLPKKGIDYTPALCSHLQLKADYSGDYEHFYVSESNLLMFISNEHLETLDTNGAVKYLSENPITAQYILATPIETPLSADEIASYKALKSNYKVTSVMNDCGAFMEVQYNADMETWINNAIDRRIAKTLAQYKEE